MLVIYEADFKEMKNYGLEFVHQSIIFYSSFGLVPDCKVVLTWPRLWKQVVDHFEVFKEDMHTGNEPFPKKRVRGQHFSDISGNQIRND